mmetsp:Transcript_55329/g.81305  ORF Transcript_55329/g.81305 Transcript_55329/m.81305 type:complete len:250 (-) Transcript_55329:659-1408(-)
MARCLAIPHGPEPSTPLVVQHFARCFSVTANRHCQRRRASARADDKLGHTAPAQLLDYKRSPQCVDVRQRAERLRRHNELLDVAHLQSSLFPLCSGIGTRHDSSSSINMQSAWLAKDTANCHEKLTNSCRHKPHRTTEEAAVEALSLTNKLCCHRPRLAAHSRRWVQRHEQADWSPSGRCSNHLCVAGRNPAANVLHMLQFHHKNIRCLDLRCNRLQLLLDIFGRHSILVLVLFTRQQFLCQGIIRLWS